MSAAIPGELTCKELVELVTEYLEDRLSLDERTRFEMHTCSCNGCRTYLGQMRDVLRVASRLAAEDVAPRAREDLLRAFRAWKAA